MKSAHSACKKYLLDSLLVTKYCLFRISGCSTRQCVDKTIQLDMKWMFHSEDI